MKRTTFFVITLFLLSMLSTPFLPQAQDISSEQIITGYTPPKVDGYLDLLDTEEKFYEYEDALLESVSPTTVTGVEMGIIDQYVKYTAGQLFVAGQLSTDSLTRDQIKSVSVQLDMNGDQSLSEGDLQVKTLMMDTGINTGNEFLDSIEMTMINVFVDQSWQPLSDYIGETEKNILRYAQFQLSAGEAGAQFELGIAHNDLQLHLEETGFVVTKADADLAALNWDLQIEDIDHQVYSANDLTELDSDGNRFASENYNINYYDVNIPELDAKDLRLDNIEMMQSSQNETEDLRLVQDKQSLVRVYVDNPTNSIQKVRVDLKGWRIDGGITSLGTLTTTFDAPRTVDRDRNDLSDTANFEIPIDWVSGDAIMVKAEITLLNGIDINLANNDRYEATQLVETQDINVYRVLFNNGTEASTQIPDQWEADVMDEGFDRVMPLDPNYEYLDTAVVGPNNFGDGDDANGQLNWAVFGIMLAISNGATMPIPDQLHATTVAGGGLADAQWAGGGGFSSWAGVNSVSGYLTSAHEINHNVMPTPQAYHIGGCDADASDDDWKANNGESDRNINELGWHSDYDLIDTDKFDFMSYCFERSRPWQWISGYRWEHSIDRFSNWVTGAPNPSLGLDQTETTSQSAILRGQFQVESEFPASLDPVFVMPGDNTIFGEKFQLPSFDEEKPYYIQIEYSDGTPTNRASLDAPIFQGEQGVIHDTDSFTFVLPGDNVQSIQSISVHRTSDNNAISQPLQRGFLELAQPEFSTEFPFENEVERDTLDLLSWAQAYETEYPLEATIQYTYDEGKTWLPLGTPITETEPGSGTFEKVINWGTIPGSVAAGSSQFRILYSNGIATSQIYYSPTFTIAPVDPTVEIKDSNDYIESEDDQGNIFFSEEATTVSTSVGSTVSLKATGSDQGNEQLDSSWYQWGVNSVPDNLSTDSLSTDAIVQNRQSEFSYKFTEAGLYNVTVQVTDQYDKSSLDHILINVTDNQYAVAENYQEFQDALESQRDSYGDENSDSQTVTITETDTVNDTAASPTASLPVASIGFITSIFLVAALVRRRK